MGRETASALDTAIGRASRRIASALFISLITPLLIACTAARDDRTTLTISVGGQSLFSYLPLTLADRLGYFRDEGLAVRIADLRGGSEAMAALLGGSGNFILNGPHTTRLTPSRRLNKLAA